MTEAAGAVHVGAVHVGWAVPAGQRYDFQRTEDAPPELARFARRTLRGLPHLDGTRSLAVRRPGYFTLSVRFEQDASTTAATFHMEHAR